MADIDIRVTGRAGRITLTRPQALNAMSYDMCMAIDAALFRTIGGFDPAQVRATLNVPQTLAGDRSASQKE